MMKNYTKKNVSIVILSIMILVVLVFILKIANYNSKEEKKYKKEFIFNPKLYNSEILNIKSYNKPFIIYFANPDCDVCEYEIELLSGKIKPVLNKYNILFITEKDEKIVRLLEKMKIYPNKGVFIGIDNKFEIYDYYHIESYPTFLILNKKFIPIKKTHTLKSFLENLE